MPVDLNKSIPQQRKKWDRLIDRAMRRGNFRLANRRINTYTALFGHH